ncbi:MAG TPA: glycerol-3-phosphate 1-O-acyltransferase PlsY [Candidatus Dormibacteraeota bacterium]|nr:glycerol-3-phosphate 1-O-acyltransferase PlsY [Candidatus Dormibacteraeota bacterium]
MLRLRDLVACVAGYLLGSLPVGVWFGKAVRNIDVREHGSGSTGTTNVLRTVGPGAAGAVFVLDVAKGSAAVGVARAMGCDRAAQAGAGVAAVVGHSWPVFAHLRGGKGVATGYGGLLMLSGPGTATAMAGGLGALAATRIVSVGSMAACAGATVGTGAAAVRGRPGSGAAFAFALGACGLVVLRHRANIARLMRGEEPRVSLGRRPDAGVGPTGADDPDHGARGADEGASGANGRAGGRDLGETQAPASGPREATSTARTG